MRDRRTDEQTNRWRGEWGWEGGGAGGTTGKFRFEKGGGGGLVNVKADKQAGAKLPVIERG